VLDEVVAPVVLVQDLTQGPYQAGVTPASGTLPVTTVDSQRWAFAVLLNDKLGSLTPVLDNQFNGRSFSFTYAEISNLDVPAANMETLRLRLCKRSDVVAAGVPQASSQLTSIQNNDGTQFVPVEIFTFGSQNIPGTNIWTGHMGDNTNTLGSVKIFDNLKPNITIGPDDALVFGTSTTAGNLPLDLTVRMAVRGFYQLQPE